MEELISFLHQAHINVQLSFNADARHGVRVVAQDGTELARMDDFQSNSRFYERQANGIAIARTVVAKLGIKV